MPQISRTDWDAFKQYQEERKHASFRNAVEKNDSARTLINQASLDQHHDSCLSKSSKDEKITELADQAYFHASGLTFPQYMAKLGETDTYKLLRVCLYFDSIAVIPRKMCN